MSLSNNLENSSRNYKHPVKKRKEILCDQNFYDVTDWVDKHPGGKIIEFYTNNKEDATLAIGQFHQRSTKKVMAILSSFKKRPATIQGNIDNKQTNKRYAALTADYLQLFEELKAEGMFDPSPIHVAYRLMEICLFATLGFYLVIQKGILSISIGVLCLAMFFGRSSYVAHESGHRSLTGVLRIDRVLEAILLGVGTGVSSIWWSSQHNRHHAMPQRLKRDVDLETLPLLAFNSRVLKPSGTQKSFFVRNQAILYFPLYTVLAAITWKFYKSLRYIARKREYFQFAIIALHYITPFYIGIFAYIVMLWLGSFYLFGNFALSHTHLPVTDEPLHWVEYALKHTINIEPSWWCNWWMGYLNFQIEHHLFPTMPQFRNQEISGRVRTLAAKHGLPYRCVSYWNAVKLTLENLDSVSKN